MSSSSAAAPKWFTQALATPYAVKTVTVDDCLIEYYQWGEADKPCLMLVHGNGGHANWWDFIAPNFMDDYCVCALHLSGMGNSAYRDFYRFETFAKEIICVAEDAGFIDKITIIGHSLGGIVTIRTAQIYQDRVDAIIVIDSPMVYWQKDAELEHLLEEKRKEKHAKQESKTHKPKKYYPDFDSALARFRLIPDQPCDNDFILEHVARFSIKQFDQGWSWKFDDRIHSRIESDLWPIEPSDLHCRFTYIYGEESILVPEHVRPKLHRILKDIGPIVGIPKGHHHLMLDEPEALISAVRSVLKAWLFSA